ncbi:hypothetical protein I350_05798 [Cryptococcus amylolentus CBS 6273]|uniref:VHS domain-containing protein n=1 Tax=Cryptococcus amylolentus CBS 6273 TaxID=1296118 RepID=A0A1E3JQ30_9TREE|nr:hypothetical protein I350_05798 [Cryptococcus amylolentus CBS 6273]
MKRIFKKAPQVDPLPPPSSQPPSNPPSGRSTPGHQGGRSIAAFFSGGAARESSDYDNAQQRPSPPQQQQHTPHHDHNKWGFGMHHQTEVTPFPSDAGAEQTPPTTGQKGKEGSPGAPSMLEIKQMQERRDQERSQAEDPASRDSRRRGQPQQPPPIHPGQRTSRGYQSSPSPDGWTIVPTASGAVGGAPGAAYEGTYPQHALPIPNASFSHQSQAQGYAQSHSSANSSPSSQSTHTTMFLPPGARPPTPPTSRPPYPIHMRYSQSNLKQSTTPNAMGVDEGKSGRERGYSSPAMATRVDGHQNESVATQHAVPRDGSAAKLQKQQPANLRSPLAHTYSTLSSTDNPPTFPSPRPYTPASSAATPTPQTQPNHVSREQPQRATPIDLPNPHIPVDDQMYGNKDLPLPPREEQQPPDHEKAKEGKKKFWGITVKSSDKKNKKAQAESHAAGHGSMQSVSLQPNAAGDWRQSVDEARRSIDGRGLDMIDSLSTSTHGQSVSQNEEEPKGRLLGLDFSRRDSAAVAQVNDVASAIQILCTSPDPSPPAIYEVCDRINHSGQGESIAKEAARALRKEFKYGDEMQRRSAGKVWFVLMRNITVKGFKGDPAHATNKKFVQALEPILTTPPAKATVSLSTKKLLTDILADLTYAYGMDKECGGLTDLWKKVKLPQEPEFGRPMPQDHPIYSHNPDQPPTSQMANLQVHPAPASHSSHNSHISQPTSLPPPPRPPRDYAGPEFAAGPGYKDLPSHSEDIRRLEEECTAAQESAKLLGEALLYTRPEELEYKPVIREFYPKVFNAYTSLTNQMDWAQAEASQSRERLSKSGALMIHDGPPADTQGPESTLEERALATLFETHAMLAEVIKQHDDLERMAVDEKELREVRERSKKETRMDRGQQMQMLSVGPTSGVASSSRSPSPTPAPLLPPVQPAPQGGNLKSNNPFRSAAPARSKSPSPDRHHLPHAPRDTNSPSNGRTVSPLGGAKLRMGPRPLPNPSKPSSAVPTPSQTPAPGATASSYGGSQSAPSRSGTGDSNGKSSVGKDGEEIDGDDLPKIPLKPSRKALGKRRAVVDEDNNFDPNDMFNPTSTDPRSTVPSSNNGLPDGEGSDESLLLGDDFTKVKPIVYAYDAYEERQKELKRLKELEERARASSGFSGGSGGSRVFA